MYNLIETLWAAIADRREAFLVIYDLVPPQPHSRTQLRARARTAHSTAHARTQMRTRAPSRTLAQPCARVRAYCACIAHRARTRAHAHSRTHIRAHTHKHTHIPTHAHLHTPDARERTQARYCSPAHPRADL